MFEADSVTQFDVVVIIIILLSSVFAFIRGFLKEFFSLAGWLGAAAITFIAYPHAVQLIDGMFKSSKVVNIVAIVLVFLAVLMVIAIINAMILDNLREMRMGIVDRSLGLLFGLLRGIIIASIIHFAVVILHENDEGPEWLTQGETYQITVIGANVIKDLAEKFKDVDLGSEADKMHEKADDIIDRGKDALEEGGERIEENMDNLEKRPPSLEGGAPIYYGGEGGE